MHDQHLVNGEARLVAELGATRWLAVGATLPLRVLHTTIRYLDPNGQQVAIAQPDLHHRDETLTGVGDPWLSARALARLGAFTVAGRLGVTVPLGRTEPDPFVLGDQGLPHEHSQFGTGTFAPIVGIDGSRQLGGVHVDAFALAIASLYANDRGYRAGSRFATGVGAASSLGTTRWRFRATVEALKETAERWHGIVHTDEGNTGRLDVLAGVEATWRVTDDWHVAASLKVPVYTHVVGGQLDVPAFVGISVGTRLRVFAGGHDAHHDHEHGDHDHDAHAADWSGLDMREATTDGSAVPLVPVAGKITVYDFWAEWCEPCGVLDRELAEVARRHPTELAVRKVDVVEVDSPASRAYLRGFTLPHIKVFGRDGALLWQRSAPPLVLASEVEQLLDPAGARPRRPTPVANARRVAIEVTDAGFAPARVAIARGEPVTLVFTRRSATTCAVDVHFVLPDGTRIDELLPLGTPVEIPITIDRAGDVTYRCGMDMNHGTLEVR